MTAQNDLDRTLGAWFRQMPRPRRRPNRSPEHRVDPDHPTAPGAHRPGRQPWVGRRIDRAASGVASPAFGRP